MATPAAAIVTALDAWLAARLDAAAGPWLAQAIAAIVAGDARALALAWGLAPRKVGKAELNPTSAECAQAAQARPGWDPRPWSLDQAARARLLLAIPAADAEGWLAAIDRLAAASDLGELVALYQALALLPHPERLRLRAAEGVRANAGPVFAAIALDNPYAADHLDDAAWNQMVLKAIFSDRPLARIVGLDRRANPALAHMISGLAHERFAAGRTITGAAWRLVAPFAVHDGALMAALTDAVARGDRDAVAALATVSAPARG
jgi:hypothetical protein